MVASKFCIRGVERNTFLDDLAFREKLDHCIVVDESLDKPDGGTLICFKAIPRRKDQSFLLGKNVGGNAMGYRNR